MKKFSTYLKESYAPKRVVKAYKLFRVNSKRPGKLFPLFVDANTPIGLGKWIEAKSGDKFPSGKVKSKLGPLAYRPGWHSGDLPVATHIGLRPKGAKKPVYRRPTEVWAEVLVPDDYDWQVIADSRAKKTKGGKIIPKTAHITDQLPLNGHYRYKTNPNMTGNWIISGQIKVIKVLSDEQVERINSAAGAKDLPREEPIDLKVFGF